MDRDASPHRPRRAATKPTTPAPHVEPAPVELKTPTVINYSTKPSPAPRR